MEYLSYQPDRPPPPCLRPETVQLSDPDTARLLVAPDSEKTEPNCPLRITESTPTGDLYQGQVLGWRWEGLGSLTLPSGVRYEGQFRDGRFHGTGTLHFPSGSKYEGQWERGVCTNGLYTFADGLSFSDSDWKYCQYPDRRFWSEIQHGLRPAGRSQVTDRDNHPAIDVPAGKYDAGDGVYDPKCRTVYDYGDARKIKRVVTDDDHQWIMSRCRRGGDTFMGRREELHQDLAPLPFRGGHSKQPLPLPEELKLDELIGVPARPAASAELTSSPPGDSREKSAALVREVLRSAHRVATTVRAILSGAAGRVTVAEEKARQLVKEAEQRAGSTSSTLSSLMDEAQRRLGSLSSSAGSSSTASASDWSSAGSSDEIGVAPTGEWTGTRRAAHAVATDSSSGESIVGSGAGSGGSRGRAGGGSASGGGSA